MSSYMATWGNSHSLLRVDRKYIFFDGKVVGEMIYDKEDTKYYMAIIQSPDGKRFSGSDLKRSRALDRAFADAGIEVFKPKKK